MTKRATILIDERELQAVMEAAAIYAREFPDEDDPLRRHERATRRALERVIQKARNRGLRAVVRW